MTERTTAQFDIERFSIEKPDNTWDQAIVWDTSCSGLEKTPKGCGGGRDVASILIRLRVDGSFDGVYANLNQVGDLAALEHSIKVLTEVHGALAELHSHRGPARNGCVQSDGENSCRLDSGHPGDCDFGPEVKP